jgi:hypothetical protein
LDFLLDDYERVGFRLRLRAAESAIAETNERTEWFGLESPTMRHPQLPSSSGLGLGAPLLELLVSPPPPIPLELLPDGEELPPLPPKPPVPP